MPETHAATYSPSACPPTAVGLTPHASHCLNSAYWTLKRMIWALLALARLAGLS